MRLPYKCPLCSKTFRTPQGRRGHLTFKHGQGKKSIYTRAIRNLIDAHKEGIEYVKEKRKRLPQKVLDEEKRAKALAFARELEGRGDGFENERRGDDGFMYVPKESFEGLNKALRHEFQSRSKGFEGLKKELRRWK